MTPTVSALPLVTPAERRAIETAERTADAHRALMASIPAMNVLEVGRPADGASDASDALACTLAWPLTVTAWNLERCYFPAESAAHIAADAPDIVLLSEMDKGMARTGQANTTADIAAALGMHHAYGVEFHELDLGGPTELPLCADDTNSEGWHGNAVLSKVPFERLALIRLDDHGHWFTVEAGSDPRQPRVGGRMAIAGVVTVDGDPLCVVSTHLESNADAAHRDVQMQRLLSAVEDFAPAMPVILGGDLNTGNAPPAFDWRVETLFETARSAGYHWDGNPDGMTTRASLISPSPKAAMKLDWFCARGVGAAEGRIVPSIDRAGRPLSDHDRIVATFAP